MNDCLGREIRVGDIISYPVRKGSSTYIRIGLVIGVDEGRVEVQVPECRSTYDRETDTLTFALEHYTTKVYATDRATIADVSAASLWQMIQHEVDQANERYNK